MIDRLLTDPLGRRITLHDWTWFGHIVKGHPEMAYQRVLVEAAVERPLEIRFSRVDAACRLYFGAGHRQEAKIVVVADLQLAIVKTTHRVRRVSGGDIEWPS